MLIKISGSRRVRRGGGWLLVAYFCEVSLRDDIDPFNRFSSVGFRVLRRYNNVNKD